MRLKPRTTMLHPRGVVFKRYTQIERSLALKTIYYTIQDQKSWIFDVNSKGFIESKVELGYSGISWVGVPNDNGNTKYIFGNTIYSYTHSSGWVSQEVSYDLGNYINIPQSAFIGNYQVNKYYMSGTFDFYIKGSITEGTTQYIKGNIVSTQSFNIKYYNEDIDLKTDDLVVVEGRLYAVESVEVDHKHQPKDFKIFSATLNNIA